VEVLRQYRQFNVKNDGALHSGEFRVDTGSAALDAELAT